METGSPDTGPATCNCSNFEDEMIFNKNKKMILKHQLSFIKTIYQKKNYIKN